LFHRHISATTIIGVPAEMYRYGTQYWALVFSGLAVTLTLIYIYMPVFYDIQTASCYVYLEKRFNKTMKLLASGLFLFYSILVIPLLIYSPAIAFAAVSGLSVHYITPVICGICIFYTSFGGIRAVIWTDTIQFGAMIIAIVVVMVLGTLELGGVWSVFEIADRGGRLVWFKLVFKKTLRNHSFQ
jgi:solute carrier family 5 (sodium-coupled monocarboxylate transporter), member 8/12